MADDFDPTPYVRPPVLDMASGFALGVALLAAVPKPAPEAVKVAARKLRKDTVALQTAWLKSDALPTAPDKRKADMRIDNAWGILLDRLEAYAFLPSAGYPKAARARELVDAISGPDREWLKLAYEAEWAESAKRLKKIADDGLTNDVNALAGPEFLAEVIAAHTAYGIAIGVTEAAPEVIQVNLAAPLRRVSRSIGHYGLAVASTVDDENPETITAARKALRPIDEFRDGQARRARAGATAPPATPAPPVSPTTPVPEVK